MKYRTDNLRINGEEEIATPEDLLTAYPISGEGSRTVFTARNNIAASIHMQSPKLVVVIGPCSIHDPKAAIEYAQKLALEADKYRDQLLIVMRVYFEKPRTTVGWKGLINDPNLDDSYAVDLGLRKARQLLVEIVDLKLPTGTEYLDPITPQYIGDLISWGAIGARTTESQIHRQLASGLSCPIGFKNNTEGSIQVAVDAIHSAKHSHIFPSVTKKGRSAIFSTSGNEDCHIILRGGHNKPNYDVQSIANADALLTKAENDTGIMVDMSHANSNKDHKRQLIVCTDICRQISDGNRKIIGVMVESNLVEGRQSLKTGQSLVFGQSITDACLGWNDSLVCLDKLAQAVSKRKK